MAAHDVPSRVSGRRYNGNVDEKPAVASEHDREHFRRLGEWERENHERALREHLARTGMERLVFCLHAARSVGGIGHGRGDDNPAAIMDRAKALGLYKG
jgi:hypothetical protein